jgi:putative hydrolase of the HAD superfamily
MFDIIAFDADDTLWHSETFYHQGREMFGRLLALHPDPDVVQQTLDRIEIYYTRHYGYGIKSFTLSMVEAAIELTDGKIAGREIESILDYAKRVLQADLDLFEGAAEALAELCGDYDLMMITKGDLFEQQSKITRSGLAGYFRYIEIVEEKSPRTYRTLLEKLGFLPERFLMVGNSLRSDILPVLEIGGQAVHIPYDGTWAYENVLDRPLGEDEYHELEHIGQVPELIRVLSSRDNTRSPSRR